LTEIINKMRTELGEPPARHDNVLREVRRVRNNLDVSAALSFDDGSYLDRNGQIRPEIQFSDEVIFNVLAEVGGEVEHQLLNLLERRLQAPQGSRAVQHL
jgi:hypothetical protein